MSWLRKPLTHLTVAVLLAIGLSVGWAFLFSTVAQTMWEVSGRPVTSYDELAVRADGVPLIVSNDRDSGQQQIRRVDGTAIDAGAPQRQLAGAYLGPRYEARADWRQRVLGISHMNQPIWWYFVHDGRPEGRAYLVGFDSKSKQRVGFIGQAGSRVDEPPDAEKIPFRGTSSVASQIACSHGYLNYGMPPITYVPYDASESRVFLISQGNLMRLELSQQRLETTYAGGDLQSVAVRTTSAGQGMLVTRADSSSPPTRVILHPGRLDELALRTDDSLLFADAQGQVTSRFLLPAELRRIGFTAYLISDQQCLLDRWSDGPRELIWLNREGTITQRQRLALRSGPRFFMNHPLFQAAAFPVPSAFGLYLADAHWNADNPQSADLQPRARWLALAGLLLISTVLAWHCFRRQQASRFAGPWGWAVFVFLLGIPGYLAYRYHRTWPTVDRCPHCHRSTTTHGGRCAHCQEAFAVPQASGVEIFA